MDRDADLVTGLVQASDFALQVDRLFLAMVGISALVVLVLLGLIITFCMRFRHSRHESPSEYAMPGYFEYLWLAIPALIFIGLFAWGAVLLLQTRIVREDALEIHIVGQQWMWMAYHPSGKRELNELHLPVNRNIKLLVSSDDVIHSFFVPAFRVKQDAVPGRYNQLFFETTKRGKFRMLCAEFCGTEHSSMQGFVQVLSATEWQDWLSQNSSGNALAEQGERLFNSLGCRDCHDENSTIPAPDLAGLNTHTVILDNGSERIRDRQYLRQAIISPDLHIVAGFEPVMPSYADQVDEEALLSLMNYLQTLEPHHE